MDNAINPLALLIAFIMLGFSALKPQSQMMWCASRLLFGCCEIYIISDLIRNLIGEIPNEVGQWCPPSFNVFSLQDQ